MRRTWIAAITLTTLVALVALSAADGLGLGSSPSESAEREEETSGLTARQQAARLFDKGQRTFRYATLGSESFFSDALSLEKALNSVSPAVALGVGLKVDVEALPDELQDAIVDGSLDLDDPANTATLLTLDSVVGVRAKVDEGVITRVGITCALCHSTVDDSLTAGIGSRLDGWANRDLDVGAIIGLAPNLDPFADLLGVDVETVVAVLASWGPGRFDAHLNLDGRAFRPDGASGSVLIPPAFGLAGVNLSTYTGWGSVAYWNAFVGNLEMNGQGTFFDPRLNDADKFPIAAANGFGDLRNSPDSITSRLPALHFYQLSLRSPEPPRDSYDPLAAKRGQALFSGKADCARCHVPPLYTEPGWGLHTPEEIGIDDFQASRSPDERYRTTPLKGLWTHTQGGFYHDGRFANLINVLDHYDSTFDLELQESEKLDLVEFLKSL